MGDVIGIVDEAHVSMDPAAGARVVGPMSRAETWFAEAFLDPTPDLERVQAEFDEVPVPGVVVGMAPGPRTSAGLPMFPFPATSAGGRLHAYSEMPYEAYLGRLRRHNLCRGAFRAAEARAAAVELYRRYRHLQRPRPRFVLCGRRVVEAFDLGDLAWFGTISREGVEYVAVPHPSGRNYEYNDPANRARAGGAVRWAARWEQDRG